VEDLKLAMNFIYLLLASASTGCLIYVVMWLEALRKGWLV
jgi:hypothetical protein